jgi:molybdenum cofactor biosynthesis enzyme MoaA
MIKPIAIVNSDYNEYLHVSYTFTNVCNYDCNYCFPNSKAGTHRFPDYDLLIKNMDHLLGIYRNNFNKKNIRMHVVGGEPTLWPRLGEFVQWCHDKYQCRVTMSSNGSRTLRWWKEYARYFDDIQISVHHEFSKLDHLKQVLDSIYAEGNIMTAAQVMMDPLEWEKCMQILDDFANHPVPWLVKARLVMDLEGKVIRPEYTEEQLEFLQDKVKRLPPLDYLTRMKTTGKIQNSDHANAMIKFDDGSEIQYKTFDVWKNHWHKFYGWECNLGVDRVTIQPDGTLTGSCSARYMFGQDTPFSIQDPDFVSKFTPAVIKPIICKEIFCSGCSSDVRISKRKLDV